jgi:hypothetical protein
MSRVQCLAFVLFVISLFSSCGLETYAILEPPDILRYTSGTIDAMDRYFSFRTSSGSPSDEVSFQGTSVFYKIYASESVMNSDISSISTVNIQYSANGYNRLTTLGYQELNTDQRNDPLIPGSTGTAVVIRLFDEASYTARVHGNDSDLTLPTWGIPLRRSNSKGFNFFATTQTEKDDNPVPLSGEPDVNYTGFTSGTEWFINAYAVSVGRNTSYANLYSQLLHLGHIWISGS